MSAGADVAIIVVNYNSAAFAGDFLASLRAVMQPSWRLVVVDAHSPDGSAELFAAATPDARVLRCGDNVGFAAGVNIGVREAAALAPRWLLLLNPDTVVTPGFLAALVAAADERTIVVPRLLFRDDPQLISTHAGGFDWRLGRFRNTFHGRADGPATRTRRDGLETASFACALLPADAFARTGPLDERFFMYYEETDWLRRALALGYRIRYEPSATVYHRESGSSGGGWMNPFKLYYATRNRLYLVRKNSGSKWQYAYFTAYFLAGRVAASARYAARREWRLLVAMWRGVADYYRGRMGRTVQPGDL